MLAGTQGSGNWANRGAPDLGDGGSLSPSDDARRTVEALFRAAYGEILSGLIRRSGLLHVWPALVPVPRAHLVRYGGCLTPHSKLREAIRPTPRQQGKEAEAARPRTPYWSWARLLERVFGLEMTTCPVCRRGTLRLIAVITQESVMTRILRHLQLASEPPPIAPSRVRQEIWAFT